MRKSCCARYPMAPHRELCRPLLFPRIQPENAVCLRNEEDFGHENVSTASPWPISDWVKDPRILHVFWDLDNKLPCFAEEYPELIEKLKSKLLKGGMLPKEASYKHIQAFANPSTCAKYDEEEINELIMSEVEDDLRCTLCGRKCKSVADLSKHFKQLHEREHKKKMGSGSPKRTRKYLESDKAERYREAAGESAGGAKSRKRIGRSGLSLKLLLKKLNISLQDVAQMDQAADIALTKNVKKLLTKVEPVLELEIQLPAAGSNDKTKNLSKAVQNHRQSPGRTADADNHIDVQAMAAYKALALKSILKERGATIPANPQDPEPSIAPPVVFKQYQRVIVIISDDFGFSEVMRLARSKGWGVVVVCSQPCASKFSPFVDAWIDWGKIY
ncbi:hypothetical protein CEUSTIGMA_g1048.t1 [Chlamydomonas eustigma]|uniref:C2H2-type domain-containing protein n=1 Tax=Chlamydomonas eustigma TaxID=1157962 RepID=A0A250WRW8_9CHLO|nr:hypothetical protein CEUSTIGMA_g1048.t1 [Chlamydomonas eustigma]|eukprot:GAX73597.1 hypothetical protein CEUSTIGMA_g1048.t1 [Chlamydomonas eustigma]